MKVITLNNILFIEHCKKLETIIRASFTPDLVVGIASGGVNVAQNIFSEIPHAQILLQRPSTDSKKKVSIFINLLKYLPLSLRNFLRIVEAKALSLNKSEKLKDVNIDIDNLEKFKRILLVDDAVDSGITLKSVLTSLSKISSDSEIQTAVITVTTPSPSIQPTYALYNNKTLIRFPWSKDFNQKK